jgi:hypothetical protein
MDELEMSAANCRQFLRDDGLLLRGSNGSAEADLKRDEKRAIKI